MENDMFVSYTGVDQKLPVADFSDIDLNDDLLNPYSDMNLGIMPGLTSFATPNPYDDMLKKLSITSVTLDTSQQESRTGTTSKSLSDFYDEVVPMIKLSVERHSAELGITDQNQKELAIKCIATQMALETGGGTSNLWKKYNNPGGLTYTSSASNYGGQRGNKLPDGNANYIYFNNRANAIEMMVDGFYNKMGRYKGILAQSKSVRDFVTRIKRAGYFGGSLSTYANNCEKFGKEYDNWKRTKLSWNT